MNTRKRIKRANALRRERMRHPMAMQAFSLAVEQAAIAMREYAKSAAIRALQWRAFGQFCAANAIVKWSDL